MSLHEYRRKRRFERTPEPQVDTRARAGHRPRFVVQLHHARARHYDFRLEVDGALRSWAVPKGPSLRAGEKRLAVEVEDHPLSYADFEGVIPKGEYGAGHVAIFDHGAWSASGDPTQAIAAGSLDFVLEGRLLSGRWRLVRTGMRGGKPQWLLVKRDDAHARDADADSLVGASSGRRRKRPGATSRTRVADREDRPESAPPPRRRDAYWRRRALALDGARKAPVPPDFPLQLARLDRSAPPGDRWLHEVKWDGYRLRAVLEHGKARLLSRNGQDWTGDFPALVAALERLPVASARLDGELVALDEQGRSDFASLQHTLSGDAVAPLRCLVFDLPALAGIDLRGVALVQRKQLLEKLLDDVDPALAYSQHIVGHGPVVFSKSAGQGLEGIISKRLDSTYDGRRSNAWIKVKHVQADEFVIVGHTAPNGTRKGLGSLLLAKAEGGRLRYVGRVGTGFDDDTLERLAARLAAVGQPGPAVALPPRPPFDPGRVRWVRPVLVAEVAFRDWSRHGQLRHASFLRLREDKSPEELGAPGGVAEMSAPRLTHAGRIVFPGVAHRKADIARYYEAVAGRMLPELAGRPVSLLRCPGGTDKPCFFQKHHAPSLGDAVGTVRIRAKDGEVALYVCITDVAGLLALVQMNAIEFHPWGARGDDPERPDRLVFDLDPGPGVGWPATVAAARDIRDRLAGLDLASFVRLSGGKGVHVVVPIQRGPSWDRVKRFCRAFADAMAAHQPERYVASAAKTRRPGRIFIDWLRNSRGATSVGNWSLRARAGAPVAMPLRWAELGRVAGPDAYDLPRAMRRVASLRTDPWDGIATLEQRLPDFE